MGIASLERELAYEVGVIIKNRNFKRKDIREWSSGEIKPQEGETVVKVEKGYNINVAFFSKLDKRGSTC